MKNTILVAIGAALVSCIITSVWWAATDDGKCEFTSDKQVIPEVFVIFDGEKNDSIFTYREP